MATVESIEMLSPGLQTTVQDLGRFGFGRYGVAPSGALDEAIQALRKMESRIKYFNKIDCRQLALDNDC